MKSQAAGNASLADYFSKPPAERLSITRTRDEENRKSKTPTRSTTRSSNHPKSAVKSESKLSTTMLKAGEVDKLVNRLTYEYKDKNARLKKESDKHHNFDAKTGPHERFSSFVTVLHNSEWLSIQENRYSAQ